MNRPILPDAMTIDVEDYFHADALAMQLPRARWSITPTRGGWTSSSNGLAATSTGTAYTSSSRCCHDACAIEHRNRPPPR
jgi:hypothetical protein